MTNANFHTSHIHGNAEWHPTNPLSTMARLSGRQITINAGGYTENLSWQALWHHNRLPHCGLLWNWGDQQHGWVMAYTQNNAKFGVPVAVTVKNYTFCYVTPYSLADTDRRFGEHHCHQLWSKKRIRDHVKIQGHDDRIQICEFLAPLCLRLTLTLRFARRALFLLQTVTTFFGIRREGNTCNRMAIFPRLNPLALIGQTGRPRPVKCREKRCPTEVQGWVFKMKVTPAVSSYIGI